MRILFVNTRERQCGVHQYGENLFHVLNWVQRHDIIRHSFESFDEFREFFGMIKPDVTIYNWQAGIGGWMGESPFDGLGKQVLVFHDLHARFDAFNAVLFSDPTMKQRGNWFPIGRPVRGKAFPAPIISEFPIIGINGFIGAWATNVVSQALKEFDRCHLRLHLPFATYGDSSGNMAAASKNACKAMLRPGVTMEASHEFMEWEDLIGWLGRNTINCYFRDEGVHWTGVSSSLDAALVANRPIAINRCNAFRHFFDCNPSILINDRSLMDIIATGVSPLVNKHNEYSAEKVAQQVFDVLEAL